MSFVDAMMNITILSEEHCLKTTERVGKWYSKVETTCDWRNHILAIPPCAQDKGMKAVW